MKDNDKLVICKKCINDFKEIPYSNPFQYRGLYTNFKVPEDNICSKCKTELYETKVTGSEIKILFNTSHDNVFLQAMIDLKESDPIEYQLKLTQFNSQNQTKEIEEDKNNIPKCPTCNSTNLKKISTTAKATNTIMFGLLGTKRHKSFHCNSCGYEW
ncbi:hypothetical protein [Kineothrix sedimenti]|uniref:Uncharacterized protein n=1 Tax=Kineothrix sedimenti TaxID=3123317 RepID=A0ABZ3F1W9_9FIRM